MILMYQTLAQGTPGGQSRYDTIVMFKLNMRYRVGRSSTAQKGSPRETNARCDAGTTESMEWQEEPWAPKATCSARLLHSHEYMNSSSSNNSSSSSSAATATVAVRKAVRLGHLSEREN